MTYNLTVRLFCGEKCFGPGMAQLLRKVQELHSLRAAAMSMNMAYSKAWTITKKAQEALGFPLLHSVTGGRGGGGAELTPEAVRMMAAYDDYCRKLRAYADDLFQEEFGYLQEENGGYDKREHECGKSIEKCHGSGCSRTNKSRIDRCHNKLT